MSDGNLGASLAKCGYLRQCRQRAISLCLEAWNAPGTIELDGRKDKLIIHRVRLSGALSFGLTGRIWNSRALRPGGGITGVDRQSGGIPVFLLVLAVTSVLLPGTLSAQASYRYSDFAACKADADDSVSSRHDATFDNELRLIVDGNYDHYRLDEDPAKCFRVPEDLKRQVAMQTVMYAGIFAGIVVVIAIALISLAASFFSRAVFRAAVVVSAIAGFFFVWNVVASVPNSPIPAVTEVMALISQMIAPRT